MLKTYYKFKSAKRRIQASMQKVKAQKAEKSC